MDSNLPIPGPQTRTSGRTSDMIAASRWCATHPRCERRWLAGRRVDLRERSHYTPEMSRRARGVELWAALRSLGRSGVTELIERTCGYARRFAEGLREA